MSTEKESRTRLAVLIAVEEYPGIPQPEDYGGLFQRATARAARWAVGRPPRGDRSIAQRVGIAPDALGTRLVAIPDSPSVREAFKDDEIPFILDARLAPEAIQLVARCGTLTRADLADALPFKRPLALQPYGGFGLPLGGLVPLATATWPTPVRTCEAYQEAHDALTAYVKQGDEDKAMAFAQKWQLTIRNRQAVLNGLLSVDWTGVMLFDNREVLATINWHVRSERDNAIPLYRRRLKHKHISLLDHDAADKMGSAEDRVLARQPHRHPCIDVLLADFTPQEAEAVARWASSGRTVGWYQAAVYVKAKDPERFALRVRRKLKRSAQKHLSAALSKPCRHCGCGLPKADGRSGA